MNKLLVISGPTATGKTQLAFKLAEKFSAIGGSASGRNGELISADSRQVYKGMDIGTGKEFSAEIKTWGCDVVSPNEEWSSAHFVKFAQEVIVDILQRGKLPIVVGGTGLYISNLLNPPETLNIPPDKKLRVELERLSVSELQEKLKQNNSQRFELMNESDRQNPRRLVRAIEITTLASKGPTFFKKRSDLIRCSHSLHIALMAPIKEIDRRIETRVRQRIEQGAEQEVRKLIEKYGWDSALKFTIGYKEWKTDKMTREEIIDLWTTHEKQYARRQLTWMAKYPPSKLFNVDRQNCYQDIEAHVSRWYYGK